MSFLDDIIDTGKEILGWALGDSVGARLARTAAIGYTLYKVTESTNKKNSPSPTANPANTQPDRGVRLQVNPDTEHSVPVVYGSAQLGGIIFDAQITNSNKTMYYAIAICEQTGTRLSDGAASVISFKNVYWNDGRIVFGADGITAQYAVDRDGNVDYSVQDQVQVYCYRNGSTNPVVPQIYSNGSLQPAYNIMPTWTNYYTADNLVFAIVRVNYNREKNITSIPQMRFQVQNSMTLPGDCLYDYMTNTRYGAGIDPTEIYSG